MPEFRPFRALRYGPDAGDPADLLAPPYDVIDPEEAEALRSRSAHNAVRLVLPEGEGAERYERAARRLNKWRSRGILVREREPAVYLYTQSFDTGEGRPRSRSALFAVLRLVPLDSGQVLPHEATHREPKEDRLALMDATDAQLSPVFLVSRDLQRRLQALTQQAWSRAEPVLSVQTPDGIDHQLRRLPAAGPSDELLRAAASDPLLVADGHHRYETALELAARRPGSEGARYVLACVVSARDPGLRILPTHRALARPPAEANWEAVLKARFDLEEVSFREPAADEAEAAALGEGSMVARAGGSGNRGWRLRPRGSALQDAGLSEAEGRLAPVVFDRLVLRGAFDLGPDEAAQTGLLSYHRDPGQAVAEAGPSRLAFLLPPLRLDDVWEVCEGRGRLPPKSTYFWPKIPSGLLFRPLED